MNTVSTLIHFFCSQRNKFLTRFSAVSLKSYFTSLSNLASYSTHTFKMFKTHDIAYCSCPLSVELRWIYPFNILSYSWLLIKS